jgi:hypothetical protein
MKAMAMNLMMKKVLVTSKQPWCELNSETSLRMNELVGVLQYQPLAGGRR